MTVPVGLAHIGLHVRDIDAVFAWYQTHFGFESQMRFPRPDLRVPLIEESGSEILLMRRGELTIELIAAPGHQPHPMAWRDHVSAVGFGGFGHLCFEVPDCFAACAQLERQGVPIKLGPTTWPQLGFSTAHFHDIEGNDLEILSFHPEGASDPVRSSP
ncbi:VOC family protein [Microbacterium deminutum]|uniref:VOC domain-containing protein n=1 Tax=Microbacterium deminutum TaxID=344164 RepID=A0ABP5CV84_9MICO